MTVASIALAEAVQHVELCVCSALTETAIAIEGQPGCPCRTCAVPGGSIQWECEAGCSGEPGQLTVHVVRVFTSVNFPLQSTLSDLCEPFTYVAELAVTLLRCVDSMDDRGSAPSCDTLARAAEVQHIDMLTVLNAVTCCVPSRPGRRRRTRTSISQQRSIGPDGGCAGSELILFMDLGGPCCEEES